MVIAHRPSPIPHRPSPIPHRPSPIAHRPSPIPQLQRAIQTNNTCEQCGVLFESTDWYPYGLLGFALVRRTWCNNLAIDFLASHPRNVTSAKDVQGVSFPLLLAVSHLAEQIKAETVWLETTDVPVSFYRKHFPSEKINDLLIVPPAKMKEVASAVRINVK